MEPICRNTAKQHGSAHYYTGNPCKAGHVAPRFVTNRTCVECAQRHGGEFYERHKVSLSQEAPKKWQQFIARNPEVRKLCRDRATAWYRDNIERAKYNGRKWRQENKEVFRAYVLERKAKKRTVSDGTVTARAIIKLLEAQHGKCACCFVGIRLGYEIDHIIAIARGGHHTISNIQLLCSTCNRQKSAKDPIEFARSKGRLV